MLLCLALALASACLGTGTFSVVLFFVPTLPELPFWAVKLYYLPSKCYPCPVGCVYILSPASVLVLVGCVVCICVFYVYCMVVCIVCVLLTCLEHLLSLLLPCGFGIPLLGSFVLMLSLCLCWCCFHTWLHLFSDLCCLDSCWHLSVSLVCFVLLLAPVHKPILFVQLLVPVP